MKIWLIILSLGYALSAQALEVPRLSGPVVDLAQVLSPHEQEELSQEIHQIWDQKLVQISVLIIPSLAGENLEDFSIKVAEKWQLGTAQEDNGVIILIAMAERKIRIEVGNGIEGTITDAFSSRLISQMKSYMRDKQFYQALHQTTQSISEKMLASTPEALAQKAEQDQKEAEARLLQEQQDQAARAVMMQKLANTFVWVLDGVLVLLALMFIYIGKIVVPQQQKSLNEESSKLSTRKDSLTSQKQKLQNDLKNNPVDPKKLTVAKLNEQVGALQDQKASLQATINKMKRYLGEK